MKLSIAPQLIITPDISKGEQLETRRLKAVEFSTVLSRLSWERLPRDLSNSGPVRGH